VRNSNDGTFDDGEDTNIPNNGDQINP
jgi:hypothetical protein